MGPKTKKVVETVVVEPTDGAMICSVVFVVSDEEKLTLLLNTNCRLDLFIHTARLQYAKKIIEKINTIKGKDFQKTDITQHPQYDTIKPLDILRQQLVETGIEGFDLIDSESKPLNTSAVCVVSY